MNEFDLLFYSIVGTELKKIRLENNFTLEYVAKSVGVTPKTIQRYELGERKINQEKLKLLVDCLGKNYDDFVKEIQRIQFQRTNNEYSSTSIQNVSVVGDNNSGQKVITANGGNLISIETLQDNHLNHPEQELIRIYRTISLKSQTKLLSLAYAMEESELK